VPDRVDSVVPVRAGLAAHSRSVSADIFSGDRAIWECSLILTSGRGDHSARLTVNREKESKAMATVSPAGTRYRTGFRPLTNKALDDWRSCIDLDCAESV